MDDAINLLVSKALHQANQNVSAAARLLGVTRDYVRYRLGIMKKGGNESGSNSKETENDGTTSTAKD